MGSSDRVVVIGTGPAGAAAAVFLSRAGLEPLLVEAGSGKAALGLTARIRGLTVAKWKRPMKRRTGVLMTGDPAAELFEELAPGGLSNHWACAVPRFSPQDFADAARAGEAYEWPIGYDDLVPWYEKVEPLLRVSGETRDVRELPAGKVTDPSALGEEWAGVVDAAQTVGRDVIAMPYAFGAKTTVTRAATAFNAFTRLVKPLERNRDVTVRYDTRALRLSFSTAEQRVTAVICTDARTGSEHSIPCRAVVLATGAVNSAQILLESKSGDFPEGLGNSHGVLGRYLHDHPLAKLVVDLGRRGPVYPASYITRPALERATPLYAAAYMQWSGALALARSALTGGRTDQLGFSVFGTMVPILDDFVALDPKKTRDGHSTLRVALHQPREALAVLEQARDELLSILTLAGWEPRLRIFHVEPPGNSVHYGGTCRMHTSPRFGVVDAFSRLHDVQNVMVADSAVFTTGPEKNPVLTAMTLAARASDQLAKELRTGDI